MATPEHRPRSRVLIDRQCGVALFVAKALLDILTATARHYARVFNLGKRDAVEAAGTATDLYWRGTPSTAMAKWALPPLKRDAAISHTSFWQGSPLMHVHLASIADLEMAASITWDRTLRSQPRFATGTYGQAQ